MGKWTILCLNVMAKPLFSWNWHRLLKLKIHCWLPSLNGGYTVDCATSKLVQTYSKVPWFKVVWGKHKALLLENVYLNIYRLVFWEIEVGPLCKKKCVALHLKLTHLIFFSAVLLLLMFGSYCCSTSKGNFCSQSV